MLIYHTGMQRRSELPFFAAKLGSGFTQLSSLTYRANSSSPQQNRQNKKVQWSRSSDSNGFSINKHWFISCETKKTFGLIFILTLSSMGAVIFTKINSAPPCIYSKLEPLVITLSFLCIRSRIP